MDRINSHHSSEFLNRWRTLSLPQQLGNVGSELSRMQIWYTKDIKIATNAFERFLELLDATIASQTEECRLRELTRVRELVVGSWYAKFSDPLLNEQMNKYFMQFAILANKTRGNA